MKFKWLSSKLIFEHLLPMAFGLLFVYAATSKLLDFENFQVQLGQSPLLSAYAGWISYLVPIGELLIAVLICFSKSRMLGLYLFYGLMLLFSIYIVFVLLFSPFVPCSCGGILEKMGWTSHLIFNLVFVFLVLIVLYRESWHKRRFVIKSVSLFILGLGLLFGLYRTSDAIIHKRNPFIRNFLPHHVTYKGALDLTYNSYYIAGYGNGQLYLGNSTSPMHLLQVDSLLKAPLTYTIIPEQSDFNFKRLRLHVQPPNFYLHDGQVPVVYKGAVGDWKAQIWNQNTYYSLFQAMDSTKVAIRGLDTERQMNTLGVLSGNRNANLNPSLLTKQVDGVFDTDGLMLFNKQLQKLIYVYYYRNQYIVADSDLETSYLGKTIDTVTQARLKVSYVTSTGMNKMSTPAYVVNEAAATSKHQLFIVSGTIGRFEKKNMWKQASTIDVYNILDGSYDYSFYVYHPQIRDFIVYDNQLFFIKDRSLHRYALKNIP